MAKLRRRRGQWLWRCRWAEAVVVATMPRSKRSVVARDYQEDAACAGDRNALRVPIVYLWIPRSESAISGRRLPRQYGAARIFFYNSVMRRYLKVRRLPP